MLGFAYWDLNISFEREICILNLNLKVNVSQVK